MRSGLRREQRTSLDDLAKGPFQAFNRDRRIDEPVYRRRDAEERHHLRPHSASALRNSRAVFTCSEALKASNAVSACSASIAW